MDLTNEQLMDFLPTDIIEFALGDKEEAQNGPKIREWILSPQIAPFESRIHAYLHAKKEAENAEPITLNDFFKGVNFEGEILQSMQEVSKTAFIYPALTAKRVFDKYYHQISAYLNEF